MHTSMMLTQRLVEDRHSAYGRKAQRRRLRIRGRDVVDPRSAAVA
jgi:hypothetical protein